MAKVKSHNASKSGISGSASAGVGTATITAQKNGNTRNFNANTWNQLPPDKQGWEEVTSKPAPVKQSATATEAKAPATEAAPPAPEMKVVQDPAKEEEVKQPTVAELEAVDVSKFTSVEKRKHTMALKAARLAEESGTVDPDVVTDGMMAVTVDQEFLDTHPEIASKGIAVGQVIHVDKEGE